VYSSVTVGGCAGKASRASHVEVHIRDAKRGDLVVELVAPNRSVRRLKVAKSSDGARGLDAVYTVNLGSFNRNGLWRLRISDRYRRGSAGYLDAWTLTL
jgi:subtilisin-like proprotein convertase family protein